MVKKRNEANPGLLKSSSESNEAGTVGASPSPPSRGEEKGKRLWKKVKYQLVEYNSLPAYMKDNEYIHRHYRAEWPLKQILLSVFSIHNETFNVWTHLIGFFLFLSLTIYTTNKVPNVVPSLSHTPNLHRIREELITSLPYVDSLPSLSNWHIKELVTNCLPERLNYTDTCVLVLSLPRSMKEDAANILGTLMARPIARWPFFAFLGGAMFCLFASSACHILYGHSQRLSYVLLRLDYAGIAAMISTSFYPPVYYSFMCHPRLCAFYMGLITLLGLGAIIGSLHLAFQSPKYRNFRASLFIVCMVFLVSHKSKTSLVILFQDNCCVIRVSATVCVFYLFR